MLRILLFTVFFLCAIGPAQVQLQQLSPQQKEVCNKEETHFRFLQEKNFKGYMSLWDDHVIGWPDYEVRPVGKPAIESSVGDEFKRQTSAKPLPAPNPEAVSLFGDVAITHYFWPESNKSDPSVHRITHTWQKSPDGWRIIGGMSCEVPRLRGLSNIAGGNASDDALSTKVDEAVTALMHEQDIPGTSVAVVRDGRIIKASGYGWANIELNVPVTPQTIFRPGPLVNNSQRPPS